MLYYTFPFFFNGHIFCHLSSSHIQKTSSSPPSNFLPNHKHIISLSSLPHHHHPPIIYLLLSLLFHFSLHAYFFYKKNFLRSYNTIFFKKRSKFDNHLHFFSNTLYLQKKLFFWSIKRRKKPHGTLHESTIWYFSESSAPGWRGCESSGRCRNIQPHSI